MSDKPRRVYSADLIRRLIVIDRELDAQASSGWHHTHSTIIRHKDQKIVANMWVSRRGGAQSYNGWETDPSKELADARFIVHARTALGHRCDIIEQLLSRIEELESK